MRAHTPVRLGPFKGLWDRGDRKNVPLDHFTEANNLKHVGNDITNRDGIGISQDVVAPLLNIKRIYNYPTQTGNTLIMLAENDTGEGEIYHYVNATTIFGPILTIPTMTDFAFIPYAGRAYISPFTTFVTGEINIQKGIDNQFLYVYAGDGTAARKAAGLAMSGTMTIANGAAGHTDPGLHVFGFVSETASGYLSPPGLLGTFTTAALSSVSFGSVDASGDPNVIKRHLVASLVIPSYNGNPEGYQLFFVPDAVINDNVTLFLNNISFFDQDLLDDASHLFDNFAEIPAGAALWLYHDKLCLSTTFDDISIVLVSAEGEPEAINQIDGLIIFPLDGNPITNGGELRDVMYVMKRARTNSWVDNGEAPSSWPMTVIDSALGTCVHGIATVLDSGSSSVDFFIVCNYAGVLLFNGRYNTVDTINQSALELSWKIQNLWENQDRNLFRKIQILNAPIQKWILIILPDGRVLAGDYSNGMNAKSIRWEPWSFLMAVNTIAIWNIDTIIFGSEVTTELMP